MSEVVNCNQCHNACKLDEVKCGRGEKFRDYIRSGGDSENYVPKKGEDHDREGRRGGRHGKHDGHHHQH